MRNTDCLFIMTLLVGGIQVKQETWERVRIWASLAFLSMNAAILQQLQEPCRGQQHSHHYYYWCDGHLVTKLSASRSSTVCLSMLGGTNSRPFLAQRVARLGDSIWHTQRFGHICARTAMATASITQSSSLSMVTTPTWKRHLKNGDKTETEMLMRFNGFVWQANARNSW